MVFNHVNEIRKEKVITGDTIEDFENKCNEFNAAHNVYATQFKAVNTTNGIRLIAMKFYKEIIKEE